MTQFYICHNKNHVTDGKECAKTPYGDINLYDPPCYPYKLQLVGLVEENTQDVIAEESDRRICMSASHRKEMLSCTLSGFATSIANDSYGGRKDHDWVPFYRPGEVIAIKVVADGHTASGVRVKIPNGNIIKDQHVLGKTIMKIPPEPDHNTILKTQRGGKLVTYRSEGRVAGWAFLDWVSPISWERMYKDYGPFDIFKPDGEL